MIATSFLVRRRGHKWLRNAVWVGWPSVAPGSNVSWHTTCTTNQSTWTWGARGRALAWDGMWILFLEGLINLGNRVENLWILLFFQKGNIVCLKLLGTRRQLFSQSGSDGILHGNFIICFEAGGSCRLLSQSQSFIFIKIFQASKSHKW